MSRRRVSRGLNVATGQDRETRRITGKSEVNNPWVRTAGAFLGTHFSDGCDNQLDLFHKYTGREKWWS